MKTHQKKASFTLLEIHYTPYGTVTFHNPDNTGKSSTRSNFSNPYLYGGYRYDPETGFYYCNARYYNPKQGRFVSRDPIGTEDGMNLLEYCGSNPVNMVDPFGFRKNIAELQENVKIRTQAMQRRQTQYWEFDKARQLAREKLAQLKNKQAGWKSHLPNLYKAKEKYGYESINDLIKEYEAKTEEYQVLIDKQQAEVLFRELLEILPEKLYQESLANLDQAYQDLIAEILREESVLEKTGDFAYDSTIGDLREKMELIREQEADIRDPNASMKAKVISGAVGALVGISLYLEFGWGGVAQNTGKKILTSPKVLDPKLNNIMSDLYKGLKSKSPIGTGSTADAIRNELLTGLPTHGKFHSQKGQQYMTALENWIKRNPNARTHPKTSKDKVIGSICEEWT